MCVQSKSVEIHSGFGGHGKAVPTLRIDRGAAHLPAPTETLQAIRNQVLATGGRPPAPTSNYTHPHFLLLTSYSLLPTSYSLLPTSYFLLPIPYSLLPTSYFLLLTAYSFHSFSRSNSAHTGVWSLGVSRPRRSLSTRQFTHTPASGPVARMWSRRHPRFRSKLLGSR